MQTIYTKETPFREYVLSLPKNMRYFIYGPQLQSHLFQLPLGRITPQDIEIFLQGELNRGVKKQNVYLKGLEVSRILRKAVRDGIIDENPWEKVKKMKFSREIPRSYTKEEMTAYTGLFRLSCLENLFLFERYCGLIGSEIRGLKWKDVDLKRGIVSIKKKGREEIMEEYFRCGSHFPQTGAQREIPLSREAALALEAEKALQEKRLKDCGREEKLSPDLPIFTDNFGEAVRREFINGEARRICKGAGLPLFTMRGLRTNFIYELLEAGVNVKTMASLTGIRHPSQAIAYWFDADMKRKNTKEAGHGRETECIRK